VVFNFVIIFTCPLNLYKIVRSISTHISVTTYVFNLKKIAEKQMNSMFSVIMVDKKNPSQSSMTVDGAVTTENKYP
jgi:hypothetical protein